MPFSVTLRNSIHERVRALSDPQQVVETLRQEVRDLPEPERRGFVHMHALDPVGEAVFNWLQVPGLINELRRSATLVGPLAGLNDVLLELEEMAEEVSKYRWYLYVVGD